MRNYKILIDGSLEKIICNSIDLNLSIGDSVIVDIDEITYSGQVIANSDVEGSFKIIRKTSQSDFKVITKNNRDALQALAEVKKIASKLQLMMNFVDCYYTFDRKQLYFLFVTDNRVDFRELVKKLAEKYRTRIELRQIGIRDKAKRIGGIGPCGLFLCCNTFLNDFNSVSINMAKNQFLALNPSKINGLCGRLLCCLKYEDDTYKDLKIGVPKIGSDYDTDKGKGKVINIDIFKENVTVELSDKSTIVVNYGKSNESIK